VWRCDFVKNKTATFIEECAGDAKGSAPIVMFERFALGDTLWGEVSSAMEANYDWRKALRFSALRLLDPKCPAAVGVSALRPPSPMEQP
jgi:hypothetical protein